jgi:hypothetical protein
MQNNLYWSSQNPHLTHKDLLHPVKVGVSCAVIARRIIGPVLFNETNNCETYVQVIVRQFFPEEREEERLYGWFQQDSATAKTAYMSMQALSNVFGDRNISNSIWSTSSRYRNPCIFSFFWSCLKINVHNNNNNNLRTKEELKIFVWKLQILL